MLHWWHPPGGPRHPHAICRRPVVAAAGGRRVLSRRPATRRCGTSASRSHWARRSKTARPSDSSRRSSRRSAARSTNTACRAIDRSLAVGAHGLPLFGCGDWNDGMNRVGQAGRGESVWMGFFLYYVLERMLPVCDARAATHDAVRRLSRAPARLRAAAQRAGLGRPVVPPRVFRRRRPAGHGRRRRVPDRRARAGLGRALRRRRRRASPARPSPRSSGGWSAKTRS